MKKLKIAIAGLGTVGKGVYDILQKDAKAIASRCQTEFEVVAVSARTKKDFIPDNVKFYTNAVDLATDDNVDVIVELIGGTTIAKDLVELSIKNGKKVVTANKALIAEHGLEIAKLVEEYNGYIGYEASTAGANPIIKAFKEGFSANDLTEIYAILNGTCNFIMTEMSNSGQDFDKTLKEAQELGYAESDPTLDIKGVDAAHKIALLSAIAAGANPVFEQLHIEGIDQVSIDDINLAKDLGYKIKLLSIYKKLEDGYQQSVYPALIKNSGQLAQVDGPYNAVLVNGSNFEWNLSIGRGAGGLTTGSSVVADLIDIASNRQSHLFGVPASELKNIELQKTSNRVGKYFIKLELDKSLAQDFSRESSFAEKVFGAKFKVDQASFIDQNDRILCGFLTGKQKEEEITSVLNSLDKNLVKSSKFIRVEEIGF